MIIESLRVEVLVALCFGCAAIAGAVGWWLRRVGEDARQQAYAATHKEFIKAAHCARDRARGETDETQGKLHRLRDEHAGCTERIEQLASALSKTRGRVDDGDTALGSAQTSLHERGRRIAELESELAAARSGQRDAEGRQAAADVVAGELDGVRKAHAVCADTIRSLRAQVTELERMLSDRDRERDAGAPQWLLAQPRGERDDLKLIRGLGPALESALNELGVFHFDQLARLTEADIVWFESRIRVVVGGIQRHHWADQARLLAARTARKHA